MKKDSESAVSIVMTDRKGERVVCSALLERDPGYFHWNRLSLLGTEEDHLRVMRIDGDQPIPWATYDNPVWPRGPDGGSMDQTSGTAFMRSIGMTGGASIGHTGVQKFADLQILDLKTAHGWAEQDLCAIHWFLQRPRGWHVYRRRKPLQESLSHYGDWWTVGGTGLKLRLVDIGELRRDPRTTAEIFLVQVPGFEIRPRQPMDQVAFAAAETLWFSLRILIAFRFRQVASPLVDFIQSPGHWQANWRSLARKPASLPPQDPEDAPVEGRIDAFFAKAAGALMRLQPQHELLHAAAFGYANSFDAAARESQLTHCVEAIERLVSAFELSRGLDYHLMDPKAWKRITKPLKAATQAQALPHALEGRIKKQLSSAPLLHLEERIARMVAAQPRRWSTRDRALLMGVAKMIKLRNDIVHGRLVGDQTGLHVEVLRARLMFERLFLNLLDCHSLRVSGLAYWVIGAMQAREAET